MQLTHLRCHNCGSRAEVVLNKAELRKVAQDGFLYRHCKQCLGETRWDVLEAAKTPHLADVDEDRGGPGGCLLVIDDDESFLAIVEKALTRENYDVEMAPSAREAITLLARTDYDLILSDIRMPDFDGRQLFQFLDTHMPEYKEKVVFLTGDVGNPETEKFLDEIKRPYLPKPVDLPALMKLIRKEMTKEE